MTSNAKTKFLNNLKGVFDLKQFPVEALVREKETITSRQITMIRMYAGAGWRDILSIGLLEPTPIRVKVIGKPAHEHMREYLVEVEIVEGLDQPASMYFQTTKSKAGKQLPNIDLDFEAKHFPEEEHMLRDYLCVSGTIALVHKDDLE